MLHPLNYEGWCSRSRVSLAGKPPPRTWLIGWARKARRSIVGPKVDSSEPTGCSDDGRATRMFANACGPRMTSSSVGPGGNSRYAAVTSMSLGRLRDRRRSDAAPRSCAPPPGPPNVLHTSANRATSRDVLRPPLPRSGSARGCAQLEKTCPRTRVPKHHRRRTGAPRTRDSGTRIRGRSAPG